MLQVVLNANTKAVQWRSLLGYYLSSLKTIMLVNVCVCLTTTLMQFVGFK